MGGKAKSYNEPTSGNIHLNNLTSLAQAAGAGFGGGGCICVYHETPQELDIGRQLYPISGARAPDGEVDWPHASVCFVVFKI